MNDDHFEKRNCPQCGEIHEKSYAVCNPIAHTEEDEKAMREALAEEVMSAAIGCGKQNLGFAHVLNYLQRKGVPKQLLEEAWQGAETGERPETVCRWAIHPVIEKDKVVGHEVLLRLGIYKQYVPVTYEQASKIKAMCMAVHGARCAAELAKNPAVPTSEEELLAAAENYEATVDRAMDDAKRKLMPPIEDVMACEQQMTAPLPGLIEFVEPEDLETIFSAAIGCGKKGSAFASVLSLLQQRGVSNDLIRTAWERFKLDFYGDAE